MEGTKTIEEITAAGIEPKWRGPEKLKRVRDYSRGSLRDAISRAQSLAELEEVRKVVVSIAAEGRISQQGLRKLDRAGAAKFAELKNRLIVAPTSHILVPKHTGEGRLIVRPGER